jgi:asparagine synthetase B (glutamine-hydrolysing)
MAVTEQERAKAFALFAQGETTGKVADTLFGGYWHKAKNLRAEYEAQDGGTSAETVETAEADEEEPAAWDLPLQLPVRRIDAIFAEFTVQEKAQAISTVLQARLDGEA